MGRYEGTTLFLGCRETIGVLLCHRPQRRQSLNKCLVQPQWGAPVPRNQVRTCDRRSTTPRPCKAEKSKKPLGGEVCLLTQGVLISVRRDRFDRSHSRVEQTPIT